MSDHQSKDRRRLLRATDALLNQIEGLRLRNLITVPPRLQAQVVQVASEIGVGLPARVPQTLADVHDQVFRLQRLLLRGGDGRKIHPNLPTSTSKTNLPPLYLPDSDASEGSPVWKEQVRLVVQRAYDRAYYLEAQADAAERRTEPGAQALAKRRRLEAEDARRNWLELAQQAERIMGHPLMVEPMPSLPTTGRLQLGDVEIDLDAKQVCRRGQPIHLTPREYACLTAFAANRERVLTREALQYLVCGDEPTLGIRSRTLDVHLSHLRAKLGSAAYFKTVSNIGFRTTGNFRIISSGEIGLPQRPKARRAIHAGWTRANSAPALGRPLTPERAPAQRLRG